MRENIKITKAEKKVFDYLNQLKESGKVNMFGASQYITAKFEFEREEASRILFLWMDNFNTDGYEHLTTID